MTQAVRHRDTGAGARWRHPAGGAEPDDAADIRAACVDVCGVAGRQVSVLRDAGARGGPGMGFRRHLVARPCGVLCPGWLRDGDVPDALDRHARCLRQCRCCRTSWCSWVARIAVVLARVRLVRVRRRDGGAGARHLGTGIRLAGVPLARHRRLSLYHYAGPDLCAAARVLPQRYGLRRQQRDDRLQDHRRVRRAGGNHTMCVVGHHRGVPVRAVPGGAVSGGVALRQGADRGARYRGPDAVPRLPAGVL